MRCGRRGVKSKTLRKRIRATRNYGYIADLDNARLPTNYAFYYSFAHNALHNSPGTSNDFRIEHVC